MGGSVSALLDIHGLSFALYLTAPSASSWAPVFNTLTDPAKYQPYRLAVKGTGHTDALLAEDVRTLCHHRFSRDVKADRTLPLSDSVRGLGSIMSCATGSREEIDIHL